MIPLLSAKYALRNKAHIREDAAGYILFWSGKNKDKRHPTGVGFMIKTSIARKVAELASWSFQDNKFATVLSVYAPTLQAETGVKEAFYRNLHNLLRQVASKDKTPYLRRLQRESGTRLQTMERSPR